MTPHENDLPRLRAADRRARSENRRAALRAGRFGARYLRRDRAPAEEEPGAHQGNLRQAERVADRAGRAPSAAALYARLRERHLHRLRRAARRPRVRRRCGDRRRPRALQRRSVHGDRPPERPRHQGKDPPQFRHAEARGLSQGAAPDEARGEIRHSGVHVHRYARAPIPASARKSAASPKRSAAISTRWPSSRCRSSAR